jgi:hypothetical protein
MGTLGRAAAEMGMKKLTYIGIITELLHPLSFEVGFWVWKLGVSGALMFWQFALQEWNCSLNGTRSRHLSDSQMGPCSAGESGIAASAT